MKKPKKKEGWKNKSEPLRGFHDGYNKAIDEYEAYHNWKMAQILKLVDISKALIKLLEK